VNMRSIIRKAIRDQVEQQARQQKYPKQWLLRRAFGKLEDKDGHGGMENAHPLWASWKGW
jgi:hypothetical protein